VLKAYDYFERVGGWVDAKIAGIEKAKEICDEIKDPYKLAPEISEK
jgi:hypothetical protein